MIGYAAVGTTPAAERARQATKAACGETSQPRPDPES